MAGLEPKNTAVRSLESNGIAESFVKTMKRDYISVMPKPDGLTAVKILAEAFEHYNEWHPHSALGYRSPREYLRRRTSNGLSDKKCMEIVSVASVPSGHNLMYSTKWCTPNSGGNKSVRYAEKCDFRQA